tara:strand:- start:14574 stop:17078 length:2505 start_codon:yes stop_codon:yes gene_type:complete
MAFTTLTNAPGVDSTGEVIQRTSLTTRENIKLEGTWDERRFNVTNATYDPTPKTLTEVGAFTDYTFTGGDIAYFRLPDGQLVQAEVASRTDADEVVLVTDIITPTTAGIVCVEPGIGRPREIEVRIVDDPHGSEVVGWTRLFDIEWDTPSSWTGELRNVAVPVGGWYNWEWRVVDVNANVLIADITHTGKWAVGAVFVLMGQSNMEDMYEDVDAIESTAEVPGALIGFYGNTTKWHQLSTVPNTGINLGFPGAAWTQSTKEITLIGAFATYSHTPGDMILVFKTGFVSMFAEVASKTDNDTIVLVEEIYATDLTGIQNQQLPTGLTALANQIATGFPSVPIGFLSASAPASAIKEESSYAGSGIWLKNVPTSLLNLGISVRVATGTRDEQLIEAVLWQQGENEALSPTVTNYTDFVPTVGYYKQALNELELEIRKKLRSWRDIPLMVATVGKYAGIEADQVSEMNGAVRSVFPRIIGDQIEWSKSRGHGICQLLGSDTQLDSVHFTPAARLLWGRRFGQVVAGTIGDSPSGSTTGPEITAATFGDEVTGALAARAPTDVELQSKLHITLRVKHDQGTTLVAGTEDHACFTCADEVGPLYVSAVTLGPVVAAGATQLVLLTVERDTAITAGKDREFIAPGFLVGPSAIVRYLYQPSFPHNAAPLDRLLFDDVAIAMPLLMPTQWNWSSGSPAHPRGHPPVVGGSPMSSYPGHSPIAVGCAITSVASIASNLIEIDAPDNWENDASGNAVIKPGDWFTVSYPLTPGFEGVYVAEGTVRKVTVYANSATVMTLEVSHDFTGQLPTTAHQLDIVTNPQTEGGILALSRSSFSFGGSPK